MTHACSVPAAGKRRTQILVSRTALVSHAPLWFLTSDTSLGYAEGTMALPSRMLPSR